MLLAGMLNIKKENPLGKSIVNQVLDRKSLVQGQFRRYQGALLWILREAFFQNKQRMLGIIAGTVLGVAAIGVALGLIFKYAKLVEDDGAMNWFGVMLQAQDQSLLYGVAGAAITLFVVGSTTIFLARQSMASLVVDFRAKSLTKVVLMFGGLPSRPSAWQNSRRLGRDLIRIQSTDARKCSISVRRLLDNLVPLTITIAGLLGLFWIHVSATILVTVLVLIAITFYYLVNRRILKAMKRLEELSPLAKRASKEMIGLFASNSNPKVAPNSLQELPQIQHVRAAHEVTRQRLSSMAWAMFIGYMSMAIILSILIVYLGRQAIADDIQWTVVIAYLFILRVTVGSMRSLFQGLTRITRFYPSIYRYQQFVEAFAGKDAEKLTEKVRLKPDESAKCEVSKGYVLKRGSLIAIRGSLRPSRYSLSYFATVLSGTRSRSKRLDLMQSMCFAAPIARPIAPVSLRELLGLPATWDFSNLGEYLHTESLDQIQKLAENCLDHRINAEAWGALSEDALKDLGLLTVVCSKRTIVLIHAGLLGAKSFDLQKLKLTDRIVVICDLALIEAKSKLPIKWQLVAAVDGSLVGIGSPTWVRENWEDIKQVLEAKAKALNGLPDDLDVSDDEEDGGDG